MSSFHFADALIRRGRELGHPCIVGLDPDLGKIPGRILAGRGRDPGSAADAIADYCLLVIDAVHDLVPAVKPQSAYFEIFGSAGVRALEKVVAAARARDLLVILDAKRGDIGSTSEAYAAAYLSRQTPGPMTVDALTLSPYLGRDSLEPFVSRTRSEGVGVFVCVKTSNPGSKDFQDLPIGEGKRLYDHVAASVEEWTCASLGEHGYGNVGAVVGATHPEAAAALRKTMPHAIFLIPGLGTQGGSPTAARALLDAQGAGGIVSSSRAIMFPPGIESAAEPAKEIRRVAEEYIRDVKDALQAVR
jgi:orotidine-5'-phosphate decarboxylase